MVDLEHNIPGYESIEPSLPEELSDTEGWSQEQWLKEFNKTRKDLENFFAARDGLAILAKTSARHMMEMNRTRRNDNSSLKSIEQTEVEIAQTFVLLGNNNIKPVPISPNNFERYWPLMNRHIYSFLKKLPDNEDATETFKAVRRRARLQTLYYRNLFTRYECEKTILSLLQKIDNQSNEELGYTVSDVYRSAIKIVEHIEDRFEIFCKNINILMRSNSRKKVLETIDFLTSLYPLSRKAWRYRDHMFETTEDLRIAGFQAAEMAWPWVFKVEEQWLNDNFPPCIVSALYNLAIIPNSLKKQDPEHIYFNNPVWKRPYIKLENNDLFSASPQLIYSFPFLIIETIIDKHPKLISAYEDARAEYLENATINLLQTALPNATIHHGVVWDDPDTGKTWENDVVVLIGNFVFVFEAKSGRINDAARRGADLSLIKNFKELFIEPGEQGWRLQNYIEKYRDAAVLKLKKDGSIINLQMDHPKIVFRYSICFEHFTNLTSSRFFLKELGLIDNDTAWAPILSLGELQMIVRFLDTELSFQHYLTRRQNLDKVINFLGDEQDILSMYLNNGLYLQTEDIEETQIAFLNSDEAVRKPYTPRNDRREPVLKSITLPPLWSKIVKELYLNNENSHKLDAINTILNQSPYVLMDFEKRIRKFRRGVPINKDEDTLITQHKIGDKIFILACHLCKNRFPPEHWQETGRNIAKMYAEEDTTIECAWLLFKQRSKEKTFDGISFYRYGFGKKPKGIK